MKTAETGKTQAGQWGFILKVLERDLPRYMNRSRAAVRILEIPGWLPHQCHASVFLPIQINIIY